MKNFIEHKINCVKPGEKYGKLTILKTGKKFSGKQNRYYALCKCDCGNEKFIIISNLKRGNTTTCGCEHYKVHVTHGVSNSPIYKKYTNMIDRCYNPKYEGFHNYGGRGIKVCDRWLNILNFIKDMEPSYKLGLTLDRVDNEGNYSPENCRWATQQEQCRNYSKNVKFTHNNKTLCLIEWAEELSIPYNMLWKRIHRGWTFEKAISNS